MRPPPPKLDPYYSQTVLEAPLRVEARVTPLRRLLWLPATAQRRLLSSEGETWTEAELATQIYQPRRWLDSGPSRDILARITRFDSSYSHTRLVDQRAFRLSNGDSRKARSTASPLFATRRGSSWRTSHLSSIKSQPSSAYVKPYRPRFVRSHHHHHEDRNY